MKDFQKLQNAFNAAQANITSIRNEIKGAVIDFMREKKVLNVSPAADDASMEERRTDLEENSVLVAFFPQMDVVRMEGLVGELVFPGDGDNVIVKGVVLPRFAGGKLAEFECSIEEVENVEELLKLI